MQKHIIPPEPNKRLGAAAIIIFLIKRPDVLRVKKVGNAFL